MLTYPNFRVDVADRVTTVIIDRPDKRNALTVQMWSDLAAICRHIGRDVSVRAAVFTGAGSSFCAGADISALSADDAAMKTAVADAESALRELPVPTVAVIRGHCAGGGTQIAVACDLRIADNTAVFAVPPAKLSVVYPASSIRGLMSLIGPAATKRLIYTAAPIDAAEAHRLGLVDLLVAPRDVPAAVDELVASMLPLAPLTQSATKAMVNAIAAGADELDVQALHARWNRIWQDSSDGREGPKAFLERRPAEFRWHPSPSEPS